MKNILLVFAFFVISILTNAQTTATQQLGTHPFQFNDTTVYKEARAISFSWNGDSLNQSQNGIYVSVRVRYYIKRGSIKAYLDTVSTTASIPINPWVSHLVTLKAIPGILIDPTTTKIVPIGTINAVDEFIYWSQLFPSVFSAINSQLLLENSQGDL